MERSIVSQRWRARAGPRKASSHPVQASMRWDSSSLACRRLAAFRFSRAVEQTRVVRTTGGTRTERYAQKWDLPTPVRGLPGTSKREAGCGRKAKWSYWLRPNTFQTPSRWGPWRWHWSYKSHQNGTRVATSTRFDMRGTCVYHICKTCVRREPCSHPVGRVAWSSSGARRLIIKWRASRDHQVARVAWSGARCEIRRALRDQTRVIAIALLIASLLHLAILFGRSPAAKQISNVPPNCMAIKLNEDRLWKMPLPSLQAMASCLESLRLSIQSNICRSETSLSIGTVPTTWTAPEMTVPEPARCFWASPRLDSLRRSAAVTPCLINWSLISLRSFASLAFLALSALSLGPGNLSLGLLGSNRLAERLPSVSPVPMLRQLILHGGREDNKVIWASRQWSILCEELRHARTLCTATSAAPAWKSAPRMPARGLTDDGAALEENELMTYVCTQSCIHHIDVHKTNVKNIGISSPCKSRWRTCRRSRYRRRKGHRDLRRETTHEHTRERCMRRVRKKSACTYRCICRHVYACVYIWIFVYMYTPTGKGQAVIDIDDHAGTSHAVPNERSLRWRRRRRRRSTIARPTYPYAKRKYTEEICLYISIYIYIYAHIKSSIYVWR